MGKLEKKTLDEIGKAIVRAGALSSREVDTITAKPELFDSIRARVSSVTNKPASRHVVRAKLVGALSSMALVGAVALAFVVFKTKPVDVVHGPPPSGTATREATKFTEPDKVVSADLPRTTASQPRVERISAKPEIKFNRPRQSAAQQIRYEGDFYALSYAGDPNETDRGGRIVRVDVPRSTLFAMGIDVPLENETETVKADLLIGSDGVTRAIRVVK
jgi:hypothetical protein